MWQKPPGLPARSLSLFTASSTRGQNRDICIKCRFVCATSMLLTFPGSPSSCGINVQVYCNKCLFLLLLLFIPLAPSHHLLLYPSDTEWGEVHLTCHWTTAPCLLCPKHIVSSQWHLQSARLLRDRCVPKNHCAVQNCTAALPFGTGAQHTKAF